MTFVSPSGMQQVQTRGNPGLVGGTILEGTFRGSGTLPQFSESGWWIAQSMSIVDRAGNHLGIDPATAGFPLRFLVVGANSDTTPPTLEVTLTPRVLWSPNHKLVEIEAVIEVSDDTDPAPVVELVSIVSNEPDNGLGDGDTPDDVQDADMGTDDRFFLVRAERSGTGSGRVYTVTYRATDEVGNIKTQVVEVVVPLNRGR